MVFTFSFVGHSLNNICMDFVANSKKKRKRKKVFQWETHSESQLCMNNNHQYCLNVQYIILLHWNRKRSDKTVYKTDADIEHTPYGDRMPYLHRYRLLAGPPSFLLVVSFFLLTIDIARLVLIFIFTNFPPIFITS